MHFQCPQCGSDFESDDRRRKFCSHSCAQSSHTGSRNASWKGGVRRSGGYVYLTRPDHPHATHRGYVAEHRLVAEAAIGRLLPESAVVHHVNEDRADNRPENLVICESQAYHIELHNRARRAAKIRSVGGNPSTDSFCGTCATARPRSEFHRNRRTLDGCDWRCKRCASRSAAERYRRQRRECA